MVLIVMMLIVMALIVMVLVVMVLVVMVLVVMVLVVMVFTDDERCQLQPGEADDPRLGVPIKFKSSCIPLVNTAPHDGDDYGKQSLERRAEPCSMVTNHVPTGS